MHFEPPPVDPALEVPATLGSRLFVGLQRVLPQHLLSRLMHGLARSRLPPVKGLLIRSFAGRYRPDLSEVLQPDLSRYPTFNAFFTRALHPAARPLDLHPAALVSPVDGTVSQLGDLEDERLVQAKGLSYTLESLLASPAWVPRFAGGSFITLYLAPRDYHRIHMPLAGMLRAAWYVPGKLFSVNAVTAASVPELFARNERVCCVFEVGGAAPGSQAAFALVLVGALLVGSISTVWHDEITPRSPRVPAELPLTTARAPLALAKGMEMGRFNMGSTVILLLAPGLAEWLPSLAAGSQVRMGEMLAHLPSREAAPSAGA
jgi:phosphatidylserine decarboxylase